MASGLVIAAIVTGWIAFIGHPLAFGIALAFPALWARCPNCSTAAFVSVGYFLAASRGLPIGAANFYGADMSLGMLLWICAAAGFVLVHALLWTDKEGWRRPARYLVAMILMAVPPFGIVGWAHPVTAAGSLFPGWGWSGLLATVILLLAMTTRWVWASGTIAAIALTVSVVTCVPVEPPPDWRGLDTNVGSRAVTSTFRDPESQQAVLAQITAAERGGARVIVLPESAAGVWTPTTARRWREAAGAATLLLGAASLKPDGYDNVMVAVTAASDNILYRQRMPIPISMWRPWAKWLGSPVGASASFVEDPVVDIAGTKAAILICYEQLLIWPVLQSFWHDPDVLLATGNGWWTNRTSIIAIQKSTVEAWAGLFGVPLVTAFNR